MAEAAPFYAFDEANHVRAYLSSDDSGLHGTDYTNTSLTSDGGDDDVDEDEDVGLQAALAASKSEMENDLRQDEPDLQRAIEAAKDADQDVKLKLDPERSIENSTAGKDFQGDVKCPRGRPWSLRRRVVVGPVFGSAEFCFICSNLINWRDLIMCTA